MGSAVQYVLMVIKRVQVFKRNIHFRKPAKTSRNVFTERSISIIRLTDENGIHGHGEAAPLSLLSVDDTPDYDKTLQSTLRDWYESPDLNEFDFSHLPSVQFGLETAMLDLQKGGTHTLFDQRFTQGEPIRINGLVWMAALDYMRAEARDKIKAGFDCIKLKVGAHDFDEELALIRELREEHRELEIRLDANGAFWMEDALTKLERLDELDIHSIEQPIRPGEWEAMADLCSNSPIPIALDEELIGVTGSRQHELLEVIRPQYIILKPNLIGGYRAADHWVELADRYGCGWWATSALESDIGLNGIAQWASSKQPKLPQGLGTGSLFIDNVPSPLFVKDQALHYDASGAWDMEGFLSDADLMFELKDQ